MVPGLARRLRRRHLYCYSRKLHVKMFMKSATQVSEAVKFLSSLEQEIISGVLTC